MATNLRKCFYSAAVLFCVFFQTQNVKAQFTVDTTLNAFSYINNLVGLGVSFGNVQFQGDGQSIGYFTGAGNNLGFNSGIVISTGLAADADNNTTNFASGILTNGLTDIPELVNNVPNCGGATNDGSILSFEFVPQSSPVSFRYIFASEEYPDYVCSDYNDAFVFLISGPGIVGEQNLAFVPGTNDPITINSINNGNIGGSVFLPSDPCILTNTQYFNFTPPNDIVYNGFTEVMTAVADVVPCSTYTLRLILADGCDSGFDSAVFLEANSFGAAPIAISQTTLNGDSTTYEGCAPAVLQFTRQNPDPFDYIFPFTLTGSAVNGVDYSPIPPTITIPAGQTSVQLSINALADGTIEGSETVELNYETVCGTISTIVYITEPPAVVVTPDPAPSLCGGQGPVTVSASASSGVPAYTYSWSGGLGTGTSISVNPLATTTYTFTATDFCGTSASVDITVPVGTTPDVPVIALPVAPICEGEEIIISASTTTVGASLFWSGPNSFATNGVGTIQIPNATVANDGIYSVYSSLNGCNSAPATVTMLVKPRPSNPVITTNSPVCEGNPINLAAAVVPGNSVITWTGPNNFAATGTVVSVASASLSDGGVYAATASLNGCDALAAGSALVVVNDTPDAPAITSNSPVCAGYDLQLNTTQTADSYSWTGPQAWTSTIQNATRPALTSAQAGNYSLAITINGCTSPAASLNVLVIDASFVPPIVSNSPVCEGSALTFNTPAINNAQYFWSGPNGFTSNLQSVSIPSSAESDEGNYSVYLVIGACTTATTTNNLVINPIPVADAGLDIQICSMSPGSIGTAPTAGYVYDWSPADGLNFSTISNPTVLLGNMSGQIFEQVYTVTVTSGGCSNTSSVRAQIIPTPVASFVAPDPQCYEGNSFDFHGEGIWTTSNPRFVWDFGPWATPDSSSLRDPQDVVFNATGLNLVRFSIIDLGCTSNTYIAPVDVKKMPVSNFTASQLVACDPAIIYFENLSENDGNPMSFQWEFGNGKSSINANPENLYSSPGSYEVSLHVSSVNGCENEYVIPGMITINPTPHAQFEAFPVVTSITAPEITITDYSTLGDECRYTMGNGDTLYSFDALYTYADTGSFVVTQLLSNAFGCSDTTSINIRVDLGYKVYIPSAFTPNDDGLNDVFRVYGEDFKEFSIAIYNRWGQLLYTSFDAENGWDGKVRLSDEPVPGGTYVYTIKLLDRYGLPYTYRGEITVLR